MELNKILRENNNEAPLKTCLESFLDNWWKEIKDKIEEIRWRLTREDYRQIFEQFVEEFFFEGFEEYWHGLLPKSDDKVIAHTDAQETNILLLKSSPNSERKIKVMLIDYEYAGLVERSWDLANYYIETMMSNNEYDSYPWVELFEENRMEDYELEKLVEEYITVVQQKSGIKLEKHVFLEEIKAMVVAINYYWGAWAIVSIDLDRVNEDDLYFPAAKIRMELIRIGKEYLTKGQN